MNSRFSSQSDRATDQLLLGDCGTMCHFVFKMPGMRRKYSHKRNSYNIYVVPHRAGTRLGQGGTVAIAKKAKILELRRFFLSMSDFPELYTNRLRFKDVSTLNAP